jgi:hypothetical protein
LISGESIVEKQESFAWGSKVVEQLAKDLKRELLDSNGFSRTNLFAMRKFYFSYKESELVRQAGGQVRIGDFPESSSIVQQDVGQIETQAAI